MVSRAEERPKPESPAPASQDSASRWTSSGRTGAAGSWCRSSAMRRRRAFAEFHSVYEVAWRRPRARRLDAHCLCRANIDPGQNPAGLGTSAIRSPRLMPAKGASSLSAPFTYPPRVSESLDDRLRELGIAKGMTVTATYGPPRHPGAESGESSVTVDQLAAGRGALLRAGIHQPWPGPSRPQARVTRDSQGGRGSGSVVEYRRT